MDKEAPVVVATVSSESEAIVIKSLLASYEIGCHYMAEMPHRFYPLQGENLPEIKIYVTANAAGEARRILDEYRRREVPIRLVDEDEEQS